jgi:hypothetical protein
MPYAVSLARSLATGPPFHLVDRSIALSLDQPSHAARTKRRSETQR